MFSYRHPDPAETVNNTKIGTRERNKERTVRIYIPSGRVNSAHIEETRKKKGRERRIEKKGET